MNSFELNKIVGAILGTLLFVMGIGFLAEAVYSPIEDRGPGYALPEPEVAEAGGAAEPEAPAVPLATLLASADPAAGQTAVRKCQSCHNFEQGAGNKQGPELYGVVGRVIGSHEGFAYSADFEAHKAAGDVWSYENLDHFIAGPKAFAAGTKMNFGGVKNPEERANILAYLQTLSDSPVPFPAPEAAAPAEEAAPAEGAAPAAGTEAVPTDAGAVATPTETQGETPVQGTATESAPGTAETPATEPQTAPAEGTAPAAQ